MLIYTSFCPSGLGMLQSSGLCVVADKLNFIRYLSHFRCVHRGAAFAKMRTTAVRKLLPESWGFLCPVHTPDGAPCGLMNHLTVHCEIVAPVHPTTTLPALLCSLGNQCGHIFSNLFIFKKGCTTSTACGLCGAGDSQNESNGVVFQVSILLTSS